jgi:PAS domain S-box-containing protein
VNDPGDGDDEGADEIVTLRAENVALRAEIAALRKTGEARAAEARDDRETSIRQAVAREEDRRQRDLAALTAQLDALIRSSSEVRYRLNADWSELVQLSGGGFIADTTKGSTGWLDDYIPAEHRDIVRAEIRRAIEARDTYHIEHKVNRVDGSVGWALSRAVPIFDAEGEIQGWMGAASDITERKAAQEMQSLLNEELAHRMKNLFSMVQVIASQTMRQALSLEEARTAIAARIHALARAQDVLTQENFASAADMGSVLTVALKPYPEARERIAMEGPPVRLDAPQALGLSLAVHELVTNAAKYGALSNADGRVAIFWDLREARLVFTWQETGGPPVEKPARRGFGTKLIEDVVAAYFSGDGHMEFRPAGVEFTLTGEPGMHREPGRAGSPLD